MHIPSVPSVTAAHWIAWSAALTAALVVAAEPPASAPAQRLTRAELVRQWDLNSDGKIDQGEAEIASSRMRRERAEMRLKAGIDPVTGLPREEHSDATAEAAAEPAKPISAEDLFGADTKPAATDDTNAKDRAGDEAQKAKAPTAGPPRFGLPRNAGRQDARFAPVTGGVRAGAPAARPGYGSKLPTAPLNAGRSPDSITPPTGIAVAPGVGPALPTQPAGGVRGGLLPTPRPVPAPRPVRRSQDPYDPY